jgi:hypothetical protein
MAIHVMARYACFVHVCIRRRAASSVMYCSIWNMRVFGTAEARGAFGELVYCFQSVLGILFGIGTAGKAGIIGSSGVLYMLTLIYI